MLRKLLCIFCQVSMAGCSYNKLLISFLTVNPYAISLEFKKPHLLPPPYTILLKQTNKKIT